ncbi:hypothetical protein PN499_09100 [Kamptonema animale CS-326]|jgi:hypothetical protein|uniref:hypothetical protein n=1 Tax=Kamptonema animale TaxID=92934 RepID=UPI00232C3F82|nr:hypothetical protein [Kamptonema animale]MDB9511335.1 hypothetical protein [Kamptonema animale CS-326]
MEILKEIGEKLYKRIVGYGRILWDIGVVIALGAWVIYTYLSPISVYNLSKYYKKKRPDILTLEVICPSEDPQNPNRLTIMEEHSFQKNIFSGDLVRFPILCFNNKVVSRSLAGRISPDLLDMGLPINPSDRAKLEIKTFYDDVSRKNWINWTIYVNPSEFSRGEYEQILCCYEAHREQIDSTLKNSQVIPWWVWKSQYARSFGFDYRTQRIAHIVYGAMPQPQVFSPQKISTGYLDNGEWIPISSETLTIYNNGEWQIEIGRKYPKSEWGNHTIGRGKVTFTDAEKVFDVQYLSFPAMDSIKDVSVSEYFAALTDSEGKKLTDFYQLGNIPSKFKN